MHRAWNTVGAVAASALLAAAGACSPESHFDGRQAVGTTPRGFVAQEVRSPSEAAAYVVRYVEALGLEGLGVRRVVTLPGRYLVYVAEQASGRAAFSLEISPAGGLRANPFPAMDPEMMWNQKYGHRARLRESAAEMKVGAKAAAARARAAVIGRPDLELGEPETGYGYYRFPLLGGGHVVGEAVVEAVGDGVVWGSFPEGAVVWKPPAGGGRP